MDTQPHNKAFDEGYDHFIKGGTIQDNPWPDGSTRYGDWEQGYQAAEQEKELATMYESFSDNIEH